MATGTLFIPLSRMFDEDPCTSGADKPSEDQEAGQVEENWRLSEDGRYLRVVG